LPDVRIDVTTETHGSPEKLRQTETALAGIERQGEATHGALGNLWAQFAAGAVAANLVERATRAVVGAFKESIKESIEAERVDRALRAALDITGHSSATAAEGMDRYAKTLQRKTVYDDEAIKSAQALIVQMRGTTDGLEAETRGAIGLASVFKMDLQSAAQAVAQGFEGNYRQLGRLIPAVREAKDEGEKHAAMVKALAGYYQRAEADADTFGGRLDQLKNSYHDLQESIGDFVTQNRTVIDTLSGIKEVIIWLDRNVQSLEGKKGFKWLDLTAPGAMLKAIKGITDAAKKSNEDYAASWAGLTQSMIGAKPAIDPIPIKIFDTAAAAEKASKEFVTLTQRFLILARETKDLKPIAFSITGDTWEPTLSTLTKLPPAVNRYEMAIKSCAAASKNMATATKAGLQETIEKISKVIQAVKKYADAVTGPLDAVFTQAQTNREIAIENEYKKRLAAIQANVADEDARQKAITALDAEYEIKRTSARRAAAKASKAVALMEATVNTAAGASRAYKDFPWPASTIVSAIVAALGLAQVGLIAAQPIPLAKGGFFKEPTLLPGRDGRTYLGGEAGPEIMSPVPMLRQIVREESRNTPSHVTTIAPGAFVLNIYTQTLDDQAIYRARTKLARAIQDMVRTDTAFAAALRA